jgi:hypothetical protein
MSRPVPTLDTLARRVALLERRLADVEGPYAETLYQLRRESVATRITLGRMAQAAGVPVATAAEIDAALDEEI